MGGHDPRDRSRQSGEKKNRNDLLRKKKEDELFKLNFNARSIFNK